jgi:hypothetical protein
MTHRLFGWLALALVGMLVAIVCSASFERQPVVDSEHAFFRPREIEMGRDAPIHIAPIVDVRLNAALRDDDLEAIVALGLPTWNAVKATYALHALRVWRQDDFASDLIRSPFGAPVYSGKALLRLFLDQDFARRTVPAWESVLKWTVQGIAARFEPTFSSNYVGVLRHQDDLLAACAVAGVPLSSPVTVDGNSGTLRDVLRCSIATFNSKNELEWTIVAYAHYLSPVNNWTNRFGETYSFDDCVDLLLKRPKEKAACLGIHIPYALCTLLRVDKQTPIISARTRGRCEAYLKEISAALERNQLPDGRWPVKWWQPDISNRKPPSTMGSVFVSITVAGHHLEWIALAPRHVRPSVESIATCVSSACRVARLLPRLEISELYPPFSHLVRAVCLLHDDTAAHVLAASVAKQRSSDAP